MKSFRGFLFSFKTLHFVQKLRSVQKFIRKKMADFGQYFVGGFQTGDNFCIVSQRNNIVYALSVYTDSSGNETMYMDSAVFTTVNSSVSVPTVFAFQNSSASQNGLGGNMSFTTTSDVGMGVTGVTGDTGMVATAVSGVGTVINVSQSSYSYPAYLLSGVSYQPTTVGVTGSTGSSPLLFQYSNSYSSSNAPNLEGPAAFPLYFIPENNCVECTSSNPMCATGTGAATSALLNAYCIFNEGSDSCTGLPTQMWASTSDCQNGIFYNYCGVGSNCGTQNCNGLCSDSTEICEPNSSGTFACKFSSSTLSKKDWIIIITVIIIFVLLLLLILFAVSRK